MKKVILVIEDDQLPYLEEALQDMMCMDDAKPYTMEVEDE